MTELKPMRGGSWDNNPRNCRSATRLRYVAGYTDLNLGFRVVCLPYSQLNAQPPSEKDCHD